MPSVLSSDAMAEQDGTQRRVPRFAHMPDDGPEPMKQAPCMLRTFAMRCSWGVSSGMTPRPSQTWQAPIGITCPPHEQPPAPEQHSVSHSPRPPQDGQSINSGFALIVRLPCRVKGWTYAPWPWDTFPATQRSLQQHPFAQYCSRGPSDPEKLRWLQGICA